MKKACLNMIIKNESKNLERLFDSIHTLIDYYVISDTGSTDNSIELVKKLGEKYGINGEIYSDSWINFSHNRSIALAHATESYNNKKFNCPWFLFIDADEYVHISDSFSFTNLNPNISYAIYKSTDSLKVRNIHLLSLTQTGWEWKGEIHNYLVNKNNEEVAICHDLKIIYTIFQGAKSHSFQNIEEKSREDARLLFSEIGNKEITDKNVHRFFLLADAYQSDKQFSKAFSQYKQILQFGKTEYAYLAGIRLGALMIDANYGFEEIEEILIKTTNINQNRKEAFYYLGKLYFKNLKYEIAIKQFLNALNTKEYINYLMYENEIYEWKIVHELFNLHFITKNKLDAKFIFEKYIQNNKFYPKMQYLFVSSLYNRLA